VAVIVSENEVGETGREGRESGIKIRTKKEELERRREVLDVLVKVNGENEADNGCREVIYGIIKYRQEYI
jgi:hypothetical protein